MRLQLEHETEITRAIDICVGHVQEYGAATFMDLADAVRCCMDIHGEETMTVGTHPVGNGFTMSSMSNPPNVVVWNGATAHISGSDRRDARPRTPGRPRTH